MPKLFYLLFDDAGTNGTRLRRTLCDDVVPVLRDAGAEEISVFASDEDVAAGSPVGASDPPIRAALSWSFDDVSERRGAEAAFGGLVPRVAGFEVRESRPLDHERERGRRIPGMKQMTCISRRPDISHEEFLRIWFNDHCKVAIETQSTFGYVRNEILRPLTSDAPENWTAIVEESFPIEALDDPMVFFDAKTEAEYAANVKRMVESCRRFLSLDQVEVTFMSEYYFG